MENSTEVPQKLKTELPHDPVYAPMTNAKEAEVDQSYEDLQHIIELAPKNDVLFITGDWNAKVGIAYISLQFSRSVISDSSWPHGLQHTRPPCPSPSPGAYSNSCPFSQWWHPTISSFVVLFSSRPQSFPASSMFTCFQLWDPGKCIDFLFSQRKLEIWRDHFMQGWAW